MPPRERHGLTGRSTSLDPTRYAVRPDLADIALADRVFAPQYARALMTVATREVAIRLTASSESEQVGTIATGGRFRVLEVARDVAWGQDGDDGPVGYVDRRALELAAAPD